MELLITGRLPESGELEGVYAAVRAACEEFGSVIGSPVETASFEGSDEERYARAFEQISDADVVVAEVSSASTGQGMELREAALLGKPIVALARKGSDVSGMVRGDPNVAALVWYEDVGDIEVLVPSVLEQLTKGSE